MESQSASLQPQQQQVIDEGQSSSHSKPHDTDEPAAKKLKIVKLEDRLSNILSCNVRRFIV